MRSLKPRLHLEAWAGLAVLGVGYALPYLEYDHAFCATPLPHPWQGRVCAALPQALPFEACSMDRVLAIHGMDWPEIWRVLKPEGRAVLVVPCVAKEPFAGEHVWPIPALIDALIAVHLYPLCVRRWPFFWPRVRIIEVQKKIYATPPPQKGCTYPARSHTIPAKANPAWG